METVFLEVFERSLEAGWLILAILLLRPLLKRSSGAILTCVWGLVGLRLVCPLFVHSSLSLLPDRQDTLPVFFQVQTQPAQAPAVDPAVSEPVAQTGTLDLTFLAAVLWLTGAAVLMLYAAVRFWQISRRVREGVPAERGIWLCDRIDSPFLLGVLRPRICLPSDITEEDRHYVVAHEKAHLRRLDHWWKLLGFLLLSLFWFHPLLWLGYCLFCRDLERACDERVLRQLGEGSKKPYAQALIRWSTSCRRLPVCPLAFGEENVKGRIRAVLNYRKPGFWVVMLAVVLCIGLAVGFLTDPEEQQAQTGYYLTIGESGVAEIQITGPDHSGGCVNADGSLFKKGEHVHLEPLDGASTHSGLQITALDRNGKIVFALSVPEGVDPALNYVTSGDWVLAPVDATQSVIGGADGPQRVVVSKSSPLQRQYPQYFGLDTSGGLTVLVWQMAAQHYACALFSGMDADQDDLPFGTIYSATIEEMRQILESYGLPEEKIAVKAIQNHLSSYWTPITPAYEADLRERLVGKAGG